MIYVVLNLVMAAFAVGLAFYIDHRSAENVNNPLTTMCVYLAVSCVAMALMLWSTFYASDRMPLLFFRLALIAATVYSIDFCVYCILFPSYNRPAVVKTIKWGVVLVSVWFVFTQITGITITEFLGLSVDSKPLFKGQLTNYFPVTWFEVFQALLLIGCPVLSVLIMILRAENRDDRLNMQKSLLNVLALVAGWISFWVIKQACGRVPMFSSLVFVAVAVIQVLLSYNSHQNFLYDLKYVVGVFVTFISCYLAPAVVVGIFFPRLWPEFALSHFVFFLEIGIVIVVCITISYQISKFLAKKQYFRSFQYAEVFEEQLSKLDYGEDPEKIVHDMQNIFIHNLGLSKMHVFVESENILKAIYEQNGSPELTLDIKNAVFDAMLNQNRMVVLKSQVDNGHLFERNKHELLKLFADTSSEAIILLAEGRRIVGLITLGQKAGGNIYADYDFITFTKFYSYFFVFGYYMRNISNQAIVGTVNREIRMSSQIITSIQENMDPIKNPKYDTGYIMEHAHNIGGEFVDLIRLSDSRHIFILGDLSGKGISASMSMVIIKSIIRTFLQETRDFKLLVEKVNRFIRYNLPKGTFFEGVFALLDFNDDTMYYINCGVPALFLYTKSYNNVIEIQGEGRVLGFAKDIGKLIKVKKVKLNPGDVIVTCTDGLIDSKSLRGETYGKERIQRSITENTSCMANVMARTMYDSAADFLAKELDDDVSILVIKRLANKN
ncbi:PP2C family protein-serine/threonine phosphatase [uncultured Treponema sp.]|uniref:PP2C family protein-serine/threonine phosphatase n=1 Tax=uncultured Treponema sp. TaxID=162155 RepID=UPI0025CC40C2|nr:PP2C family protein-serine/threonine phosphatase [uncultured Treponema sp.]